MNDDVRERLLASMELAHQAFQQREAACWIVLSYDREAIGTFGPEAIAGAYGPFESAEIALVEAGKHDNTSLEGFANVVVAIYPPVQWKDER